MRKGQLNNGITIQIEQNTTGLATKVILTINGRAEKGISQYKVESGETKTYVAGTKEITETYEVIANGSYTFTITNSEGETASKTIEINNIITDEIQISASPSTPTKDNVIVTVIWPNGTDIADKQIKIGEGEWKKYTGETTQVEVTSNCTVQVRVKNSIEEMKTASITINNIDKNPPIVTVVSEGAETITEGDSNEISQYFTYTANGTAEISSVVYTDTSNGDVEITNTNTLAVGTHAIKCTVTKATGLSASAIKTIVVEKEKGVYGNLYKISDTEYHLIFNSTGELAQGYTQEQLVCGSQDISNGCNFEWLDGVLLEAWAQYSENIKRVIIEEEIMPQSTSAYFMGLSSISTIENIENLKTENVTDMSYMFNNCTGLTELELSNLDTSNVTNMEYMFSYCSGLTTLDLSNFDTSNVTAMNGMFSYCSGLTTLDLSNFNTSNVTRMYGMFRKCSELQQLNLSSFNTNKVTNMSGMFQICENLTSLDLGHFNTENVTDMSMMFAYCEKLIYLNVSNFNTQNVTNMSEMFCNCTSLTELNVSNFDTSNVTFIIGMFDSCEGLKTLDVSKFNVSKVNYLNSMFYYCKNLTSLDLSNFETNNVTSMTYMFSGSSNLTTIYVSDKWSTNAVTSSTNMFSNCTALKGAISYDSTKIDATYANYTTGYLTYKATE